MTRILTAPPSAVLPDNCTPITRASVDTDGYRMLAIDLPLRDLFDPDRCPVDMLDILAYTWSVDEWEPDWPEALKRHAVREAPAYHRIKGTRGALRRAVESLGYAGLDVAEWFEYGGEPYRFRITLDITDRPFDLADYNQIYRAAIRAKNVRSHLEAIATRLTVLVDGPYIAGVHYMTLRARVHPARPPHLSTATAVGRGAVVLPVRVIARVTPLPTP